MLWLVCGPWQPISCNFSFARSSPGCPAMKNIETSTQVAPPPYQPSTSNGRLREPPGSPPLYQSPFNIRGPRDSPAAPPPYQPVWYIDVPQHAFGYCQTALSSPFELHPQSVGSPTTPAQRRQQAAQRCVIVVNSEGEVVADYIAVDDTYHNHKTFACLAGWMCGVFFGLIAYILAGRSW